MRAGTFVIAATIVGVGCTTATYRFRGATIVPAPSPLTFIAGAAKVEITPPPGFPLAGFSFGAGVARGQWSPLFARAFYFRDVEGRVITLVSVDLYAVSAGLRLEVLRRVNAAGVYLPSAGFVLAATHTHHGPGGHMTAALYNGFGAALPGFDRRFFNVLAERLTAAVVEAARDSAPSDIVISTGSAVGIQRNRAIGPFFTNGDLLRRRIVAAAVAAGVRCPGGETLCPRYQAVDPSLKTITIRKNSRAVAMLVLFAVHPTAMSQDSPLFSSDLTGHAMSLIEERSGHEGFVAGFFNGAQGDISPDWVHQDRADVLRLGQRLADAVASLNTNGVPIAPTLATAMREFKRNWRDPTLGGPRLASKPLVGAAALGGAEDGRTPFHAMGWRAGVKSTENGCSTRQQGCKEPALDGPLRTALRNMDLPKTGALVDWFGLTSRLAPASDFPTLIPITVVRFGDALTLATVPVEMTTAMAWRVREALGFRLEQFALVGRANEYFSYTTTPEEYGEQAYEGASTLAGPQQGPAIEAMVKAVLAELLSGPPAKERIAGRTFEVGSDRDIPFGPALLGIPRPMVDEGLAPLWPHVLAFREPAVPRFSWTEPSTADWSRDRRIRIRDAETNAEIEGRRSSNILTVMTAGCTSSRCDRPWTAMWLPAVAFHSTVRYYFEVRTGDHRDICSPPFTLTPGGVIPVPDVGAPVTCPVRRPESRR